MAVKELIPTENVAIATDALDRLSCFQDGIDTLVLELAEEMAKVRISSMNPHQRIYVEVQDVLKAGDIVLNAIREAIAQKKVSADLSNAVDNMESCFKS